MIIIRNMVKHSVSVLAGSLVEKKTRQAYDLRTDQCFHKALVHGKISDHSLPHRYVPDTVTEHTGQNQRLPCSVFFGYVYRSKSHQVGTIEQG